MRPSTLAACLLLSTPLLAAPALAADTVLHVADTETVMASPDELAAVLRIELTGRDAAALQAKVNAAMQDALGRAKQVAGVTASTGGYNVWRTGNTPQERANNWQVTQSLNLTSHDGAALLTLVGDLQQRGLVVGSLGWRLSREAERKAHQQATRQALSALRGRIDEAAGLLGLQFSQFKDVRLDTPQPPRPMFRMAAPMAMAAAAPAPPPVAEAEDVPVTATAEADALLVPH